MSAISSPVEALKFGLAQFLLKCGVDLRRASHVPFGVRWHHDIRYFCDGRPLETIFDVGANEGQTAVTLARQFPQSRIYSFEPVPSTFQRLVRNTALCAAVVPVCRALGASRGCATMTAEALSPNNTHNTLKVGVGFDVNGKPTVDVQLDTIDSFCVQRYIHRVNLLKIDTEGYELEVLKGAEKLLTAKGVDFVVAECDFLQRDGEPHGRFLDILGYVSRFGFNVVSFYTGGVDDLGWVWGDVLFRLCSGSQPGRVATSPAGHAAPHT